MSDVEKAISGEDKEKATRTTKTAATYPHTTNTQAVKQQQHLHHQYYNKTAHYNHCNNDTPAKTKTTPAAGYQHSQTNANSTNTNTNNTCVSRLLKIIFSTPGLVLLVVAYSVMGALIFPLLEAPQDITKSAAIAKSREECLRELWIITEKLNVLYERNWTMLVHEQLRRFEGSIVAATRSGSIGSSGAGTGSSAGNRNTAVGFFGGNNVDTTTIDGVRWSFSEALLYSVTVITTIGHGSLTPRTAAGKIATILYALFGVPLMLMCLSSLGGLLAEALQCTYARICCRFSSHYGNRRDGQCKSRQRRCSDVSHEERICGEGEGKQNNAANVLDCKGCKYDALIGETNLSSGYDYGSSCGATMEDSCQLLHNSPAKVNQHNSPCMQLKMATATAAMATNAQYYQRTMQPMQQQQQQQEKQQQQYQQQQVQHQQRPDVMLMTTNTSATAGVAQKFQQQQQQQSSATSSPQHHFQHPLQTFHIVSSATASANSSPTHQMLRQYATLQPQHYQQQQHPQQQQQQQHFIAIPSSMVRFQTVPPANQCIVSGSPATTTTTGAIDNIGTHSIPPNCYPSSSAAVGVTGAATIYFPFATSVGNASGGVATSTGSTGTAAGAATVAPTTSLLCNQPLVKYHTIQLQHKKSYSCSAAAPPPPPSSSSSATVTNDCDSSVTDALPLPPPPAYQTATVHGVRRAKFLTKPLPPEINTLLAENDLSCRQDLIQNSNATPSITATTATTTIPATTAITTMTTAITTPAASDFFATSTSATAGARTTAAVAGAEGGVEGRTVVAGNAGTTDLTTSCVNTYKTAATPGLGSTTTVDIMEDEEEQEQQRLGNCPHGTPSRVPLISSNQNSNAEKSTRNLINATAASFHRHTLQTFQRGNNRKTATTTFMPARRGCNMHTTSNKMFNAAYSAASSSGGCYGDTATETSDDDEYSSMQHVSSGGREHFMLNQINTAATKADNLGMDDADDDDDLDSNAAGDLATQEGPQVPISIVLLILVCYICLGTVIFAFWENWSLIDGAYFCFVTLTTIGYGDFLPERTFYGPEVQLFACCAYLLLGLVLVAMSFSILETQLMWKCKRIAVRLKLAKD